MAAFGGQGVVDRLPTQIDPKLVQYSCEARAHSTREGDPIEAPVLGGGNLGGPLGKPQDQGFRDAGSPIAGIGTEVPASLYTHIKSWCMACAARLPAVVSCHGASA